MNEATCSTPTPTPAEFDRYAADYDGALNQGLSLSGERKEFFAQGRTAWLARCLKAVNLVPRRVLDFGCGTGTTTSCLLQELGAGHVCGVDLSAASVAVAERQWGGERASFQTLADFVPDGSFDAAYCNGVFHHIPPADRPGNVAAVFAALRPGGVFALWENNPWNPATRLVMSRIPFDRDAILVWPSGARRLLRAAGFEVLGTDFLFLFPKPLSLLRPVEKWLCRLPFGAQYQILARRPV